MTRDSAARDGPYAAGTLHSDAQLIAEVRLGDTGRYAELFERHRHAATRLARRLVQDSDADDLVAEAFTQMFAQLRRGMGPDEAFRAYLLTTIRNLHARHSRRTKVEAAGAARTLDWGAHFDESSCPESRLSLDYERSLAALAFASLPVRWRTVLWHLDVEQRRPAAIAPLLGLSPNGVSALAVRAREGLRRAYVRAHASNIADDHCRKYVEDMADCLRKARSVRSVTRMHQHLGKCDRCRDAYAEMVEANSSLPGRMNLRGHPAPSTAAELLAPSTAATNMHPGPSSEGSIPRSRAAS